MRLNPTPEDAAILARQLDRVDRAAAAAHMAGKLKTATYLEVMQRAADDYLERPKVVHILSAGFALCGFDGERYHVPADWPNNHKWVGLAEIDAVTCEQCRHFGRLARRG